LNRVAEAIETSGGSQDKNKERLTAEDGAQPSKWQGRLPEGVQPISTAPEHSATPICVYEPSGASHWAIHHQGSFRKLRPLREAQPPAEWPEALKKPVSELNLSTRAENCLENDNINFVGDLVQMTRAELLRIPGLGPHTCGGIKEALAKMGLCLGTNLEMNAGGQA
jgi:Bacterial RNA polymerase, alpha chain C terminal domain